MCVVFLCVGLCRAASACSSSVHSHSGVFCVLGYAVDLRLHLSSIYCPVCSPPPLPHGVHTCISPFPTQVVGYAESSFSFNLREYRALLRGDRARATTALATFVQNGTAGYKDLFRATASFDV